ncbi:multidrug effflux MFS transporter [Pseudomonas sp. WS 5111]|jgi:MFS family permease|uniref:MFS transporter n=1 Tax=unclassified Pseudomonas TaxID=196821 RepID=UPI00147651DD|nr:MULTISPECIES: MFS transporter [unclassified Pseudomonas]NMX66978.1 multidrug effflux MFS transporter [Pseudomonas sp. WS 5111]NMX85042.1 multidrug effflux MFS transporter [Pseudomonas sp. WS 5010]
MSSSTQRVLLLACCTTIIAQLGVTLYIPATTQLAPQLNIEEAKGYKILLFYLGGAVLPIAFMSRLIRSFGRYTAVLVCCAILLVGSALSLFSFGPEAFFFSRFTQGLGAGGGALIGRALLTDISSGAALAKNLSVLSYSFILALIGGQVVGGFLVSSLNWIALPCLMIIAVILISALALNIRSHLYKLDTLVKESALTPKYYAIATQPSFYLPVILGGCGYGIFIVYQGIGAYVFHSNFRWNSADYGTFGLWLGLAYYLGAFTVRRALSAVSVCQLSIFGACLLVASSSVLFLAAWQNMSIHLVIGGYLVIWYAQATLYPCTAAMAVNGLPGANPMMLFSFLQQLVALTFGALATFFIPYGIQTVALLTACLGGLGVVTALLILKREA